MRKLIFILITIFAINALSYSKTIKEGSTKQEWKNYLESRVKAYKFKFKNVLPLQVEKVFRTGKNTYVYKHLNSYFELTVTKKNHITKTEISKNYYAGCKKKCIIKLTNHWLKHKGLSKGDLLN